MMFAIRNKTGGFQGRYFCLMLVLACFLTAGATSSFAGSGGPRLSSSQEGGGTWGAILQLSVEVYGSAARFIVSKKGGLSFGTESSIVIRAGSSSGQNVASSWIESGSGSAILTVNLSSVSASQAFYAYLKNSYGYAWAGPVYLPEGVEDAYYPAERSDYPVVRHYGKYPAPPFLDGWPAETSLCEDTLIGVKAQPSVCHRGKVRIECKAEDDGRPFSQWLQPGEKEYLHFRFHAAGNKTICCRAIDDCDRNSTWTRRTIRVRPCYQPAVNQPPEPPVIRPQPSEACMKRSVRISVTPGADPDGDQVQVRCTAEEAEGSPYSSMWYSELYPAVPEFTFYTEGTKKLTCFTQDSKGATSAPVSQFIDVHPCKKPCLDTSCHPSPSVHTETKISISVISDADSNGKRIRVQRDDNEDAAPDDSADEQAQEESDQDTSSSYSDDSKENEDSSANMP